jgi:hypothetical protein
VSVNSLKDLGGNPAAMVAGHATLHLSNDTDVGGRYRLLMLDYPVGSKLYGQPENDANVRATSSRPSVHIRKMLAWMIGERP